MIRDELVLYVEAALLAAGRPVALDEFVAMFEDRVDAPDRNAIRDAVAVLAERWRGRSLEIVEVASGFRAQVRKEFSQAISVLWQERPTRYSRALLETLALIAYRQPVSRGEIEDVRGVNVSSSIMKTLIEREWVRIVGHRETPGRPALYGTTKHFLDTFNLKSLEALPPLAELKALEDPPPDLFTGTAGVSAAGEDAAPSGTSTAVEAGTADATAAEDAAPGTKSGVEVETADAEVFEDAAAPGTDSAIEAETAGAAATEDMTLPGTKPAIEAGTTDAAAARESAARWERVASAGGGPESSNDAAAPNPETGADGGAGTD